MLRKEILSTAVEGVRPPKLCYDGLNNKFDSHKVA